LMPPIHNFSAPSKESVHVALLALSLLGNERARLFFNVSAEKAGKSVDELAVDILQKKMNAYERFNAQYPGYGGYLPWYVITDSSLFPIPPGWTSRVPSLDNGEWVWALKAAVEALEQREQPTLAKRYSSYIDMLAKNALLVFYAGEGKLRTVTVIANMSAPPSPGNYYGPPQVGYLDDPYEGELFTFFVDLYSMAHDPAEREKMWVYKRELLQAVKYHTPSGPITVQRGWWFSSHEQWKYLEMPYLEVPINKRVFLNGERARTWNSALKGIPGLLASVNDVSKNENIPDYLGATGIREIAFEEIASTSVVTPYGAFPMFLASEDVAAAWYHVMLSGGRMQGPFGTTEAINTTGTAISPVVTWDSKITTVLAMTGGIAPVISKILKKEGNYQRFYDVVDREWSRVFPSLAGESLAFALPRATIPTAPLGDFSQCRTPKSSSRV